MSSASDPVLRAIRGETGGRERDLARLGDLVRRAAAPPRPADLAARVRAAIAEATVGEDDEDALVDAWFDGRSQAAAAALPELQRLGSMVREAAIPDRPVDLLPQLEHLGRRESERYGVMPKLDANTRGRIWTAVIGGHLAALLALTVVDLNIARPVRDRSAVVSPCQYRVDLERYIRRNGEGPSPLPAVLPGSWNELAGDAESLFLLRRDAAARDFGRQRFLLEGSGRTVAAMVRYLRAVQTPSGSVGPLTGDRRADLAAQAVAALALLGECGGDDEAMAAARRCLEFLAGERSARGGAGDDPVVEGLCALALVEGGVLLHASGLRSAAERLFADLPAGLVREARGGGREGFLLVAVELARLAGWAVPGDLSAAVTERIGQAMPQGHHDAGQQGLAAFIRIVQGRGAGGVLAVRLDGLAHEFAEGATATGRADPLGWFFPTFALREQGGDAWRSWSEAVQRSLLVHVRYRQQEQTEGAQAWMPAAHTAWAETLGAAGDVWATGLAVLVLSAGHRYLPMAGS